MLGNQKTTIGQSAKACAEVTLPLLRCACRGPRRFTGERGSMGASKGQEASPSRSRVSRPPRYVFCRGPVPPFLHAPGTSFPLTPIAGRCHAPLASRPLGGSPPLVARTGSRVSFLQLPMAPTTGAREARAASRRFSHPGGSHFTKNRRGDETPPSSRRWRGTRRCGATKLPRGAENVGATDTPNGCGPGY